MAANDSRSYRRSPSGTADSYRDAPAGHGNSVPEGYQTPAVGYGYNGSLPHSYQTPAAGTGGYPTAGGYERPQHGQPASPVPGYDAGRPDPLAGYSTPSSSYGYSGYDGQGTAGGYPGYGTDGYAGYAAGTNAGQNGSHHQSGSAYLPSTQAAYPYQPGVPESYQAPAAETAPYHYQPPSGQHAHNGELGGYAGADPYAVDPYGYSGFGNESY